MKKSILSALIVALAVIGLDSCQTITGSLSQNAFIAPRTKATSVNEYSLNVSSKSITYTIDASTRDGAAKLNKLSLREAQKLALTEAVMKNNCVMIVNPQYTHIKKGRRIQRITVYGFPAYYNNPTKTIRLKK